MEFIREKRNWTILARARHLGQSCMKTCTSDTHILCPTARTLYTLMALKVMTLSIFDEGTQIFLIYKIWKLFFFYFPNSKYCWPIKQNICWSYPYYVLSYISFKPFNQSQINLIGTYLAHYFIKSFFGEQFFSRISIFPKDVVATSYSRKCDGAFENNIRYSSSLSSDISTFYFSMIRFCMQCF